MELEEYLEQQEQPVESAFVVDTEDKAIWAMRKLAAINKKIAERDETAKLAIAKLNEEINKIEQWKTDENISDKKAAQFFEDLLIQYGMKNIEGKKKSIKLPNGVIKLRKSQAKLTYCDDLLIDQLKGTDFCKQKVSLSIDKAALKKSLEINGFEVKLNGEKINGIMVLEPEGEKWSVDTEG